MVEIREVSIRSLGLGAIVNLTVMERSCLYMESIGIVGGLLKLLSSQEQVLSVFAASALWNMCKSTEINLKLETSHGIVQDKFMEQLNLVLHAYFKMFDFTINQLGLIYPTKENLNLFLITMGNAHGKIALSMEQYHDAYKETPERVMESISETSQKLKHQRKHHQYIKRAVGK